LTQPRSRCSVAARERNDWLAATASHVRGWILLEQPGPWGRDAVLSTRLPPTFTRALQERSHATGVRVVMLRGHAPDPSGVHAFAAFAGGAGQFVEHAVLDRVEDVLDVRWEPLIEGKPIGLGSAHRRPLFLVCTNGRHDVCCAERGRPLFESMRAAYPEETWECSHIGGDRFAGNLLVFPHGLYYGWVAPDEGPRIGAAYEQGLVNLERYRGRCAHPRVVQAAEHFLRAREGLLGVDDLVARTRRRVSADETEVRFDATGGGTFVVGVRARLDADPALLTCTAQEPTVARRFELIGIRTA
jgi:hypothetical protein